MPTAAGTGSPTCILYYSTSGGGPFPGYNVKPNVPYRITASEGVKVYFYYTYSFGGMQKNSSAAMHTYEIGSCTGSSPFLYIPVTSVNVTAGANSKATFTIDTNQDCTVVSDQSWLTVSAGLVNKFTTITVTAEANPTAVQRSAIVTVSSTTSGIKTVNVKQAAGSTGIEELNSGEILIFPVPVDDKLTIKGINGKSTAEIYDVCGNLILTKVLNKPENEIELSHLTKGVYFIKLQTDKKLIVKQIVKR